MFWKYETTVTWCLQNFTETALVKNVQKKNCSAGFGDYCYITEYKSAFYTKRDRKRVKTGISLSKFPKDNTERRRWTNIISLYERKGAGGNFSPYDESKKYFVCEHHFKVDEIRFSFGIRRKGLDNESFLNLFEFLDPGEKCKNIKFYDSSRRSSIWSSVSFVVKLIGFIEIRKKA